MNFAKMLLAGIITFGVCLVAGEWFNTLIMPKYIFEIAKIFTISLVCFLVYFVLNLLFKVNYVQELVNRLLARFKSTD